MSFLVGPLLPDELVFSLPGRILKKYPSLGKSGIREIFGGIYFPTAKAFPTRLSQIAQAFEYEGAPTAEVLARDHTFLPFAEVVLSREYAKRLLSSMVGEFTFGRVPEFLNPADSASIRTLRGCPLCVEDDFNAFGSAYWHRLHQVPSLSVCHKHRVPLARTKIDWATQTFHRIEDSIISSTASGAASSPIQQILCAGYEALAGFREPLPERSQILQLLISLLKSAGLLNGIGDPVKAVTRALFSQFGASALAELNLLNEEALHPIVHGLIFRPKDFDTPIEPVHLILLTALTSSTFGFLLKRAAEFRASEGPWLCMSIGNPCSATASIHTMVKTKFQKLPVARFICSNCGTRYLRPLPLSESADGSFEYELTQKHVARMLALRGKLEVLWPHPAHTWKNLAHDLGQSRRSIARLAGKFGLPDMPGRNLRGYRQATTLRSRDWAFWRTKRKAELDAFLAQNPGATRGMVQRHSSALYSWLHRNAPEFLAEIPKTSGHLQVGNGFYNNLEEYDQECAEMVNRFGPAARNQLLASWRRVTVNRIRNIIDPKRRTNLYGRSKLNLTFAALHSLAETREQHFERLFTKMCRDLDSGKCPKRLRYLLTQSHLQPYYSISAEFKSRILNAFSRSKATTR